MFGPFHGKYALIQFCPEPDRMEFINVGLILSIPDAAGYLRVEFVEEPKRVERLFGHISERYFRSVADVIKFRVEEGFNREFPFDFDEFIDRRANDVRITRLMSIRIDHDPDWEFDALFNKLVGTRRVRPPASRARAELKNLFREYNVEQILDRPREIKLKTSDISIRAPYAYQNGHYNLIDSIRITEDDSYSLREVGKKAIEGDLLRRENEFFGARLVIVADFSRQSRSFFDAVEDHMESCGVKLLEVSDVGVLIEDIRAHANFGFKDSGHRLP
jgi:hypothetical protein